MADRDDQDAALAHQQELERREREETEMLGSNEYLKWLIELYREAKPNEIPRESIR